MKIQEVILRALAKKITWCLAAEIIGISDRQMRRRFSIIQRKLAKPHLPSFLHKQLDVTPNRICRGCACTIL
jgi:hypothetical protein